MEKLSLGNGVNEDESIRYLDVISTIVNKWIFRSTGNVCPSTFEIPWPVLVECCTYNASQAQGHIIDTSAENAGERRMGASPYIQINFRGGVSVPTLFLGYASQL